MSFMILSENMKEVECYTEDEMKNLFIQEEEGIQTSSSRFLNLPQLYLQNYKTFKIRSTSKGLQLIPIQREEITVFCNKEDEKQWIINNKKIIWNNYKIPDFIVGLKSFKQWYDEKYKKNIFILGEVHYPVSKYKEAPNVVRSDKFIIDWITKVPKFVDFYLEINPVDVINDSYTASKLSTLEFFSHSMPFHILTERFVHCFSKRNKHQCRDSGRFHYIDFRPYIFDYEETKVDALLQWFLNVIKMYVDYFQGVDVDINKLLNELNDMGNVYQSLNLINEALWEISRCEKQLRNIDDQSIATSIRKYSGALYDDYSTEIISFLENRDINSSRDTNYILNLLMHFIAIPMDCYTLARMYKSTIIEQNYIVVFCGNNHARMYNNFLKHRCRLINSAYSTIDTLIVSTKGFNLNGE